MQEGSQLKQSNSDIGLDFIVPPIENSKIPFTMFLPQTTVKIHHCALKGLGLFLVLMESDAHSKIWQGIQRHTITMHKPQSTSRTTSLLLSINNSWLNVSFPVTISQGSAISSFRSSSSPLNPNSSYLVQPSFCIHPPPVHHHLQANASFLDDSHIYLSYIFPLCTTMTKCL